MITRARLKTQKGTPVVLHSGTNVRNDAVTIAAKSNGADYAITGFTLRAVLQKPGALPNKDLMHASAMTCTITDGPGGEFTIPFDTTELTGAEDDAVLTIYRIDGSSKIIPMGELLVDVKSASVTA